MIGKKLKELIKQKNIRQVKLAKDVGISPSRLSNYLSDKRDPDLGMLTHIAYYLGADLNYFSPIRLKCDHGHSHRHLMQMEEPVVMAETDQTVNVPVIPVTSRRSTKYKTVPLSRLLLETLNITNPEIVVLYVNAKHDTDLSRFNLRYGDFLLAIPYNISNIRSGDCVLVTGKTYQMYNYFKDGNKELLIPFNISKTISTAEIKPNYIIKYSFRGLAA